MSISLHPKGFKEAKRARDVYLAKGFIYLQADFTDR